MIEAAPALLLVLLGYFLRWLSEPRRVPTVRLIVPPGCWVGHAPQDGTKIENVHETGAAE